MERRLTIPHNEQIWTDWYDVWKQVKRFALLSSITAIAVIFIGAAAWLSVSMMKDNEGTLNNSSIQVDSKLVSTMLGGELLGYSSRQASNSYSLSEMVSAIMSNLSNGTYGNHASLITSQLPLSEVEEQSYLMSSGSGSGSDPNIGPLDEHEYSHDEMNDNELEEILNELETDKVVESPPANNSAIGTDAEDSIVFVYHTHNRESWNSEVQEGESNASSKSKNITLVGKRLAKQLESKGMKTMVSDTDYPTMVPDYEWAYSYKYSRKTVKEAIASNDQLQFFFDLHRDSQARKYTTAEINGESYAQVYFIIGQRNPNWKENEAFAKKIHEKLEKKYPGLSRGIWGKTASSGNAEYNQSLAAQNVLIEVGGVDNTIEESYRTADALAEVIAEIYEENKVKV